MTIRRTVWVGVLGLCLAPVASVNGAESTEAQAGHNLYEQHCYVCHGLRGKGDGPLAEELRVAPADLTAIAKRRGGVFPEVELRETIDGRRRVRGHGPANMPIWGKVFGQQGAGAAHESEIRDKIESLVVYLKSIQEPPLPEPTAR